MMLAEHEAEGISPLLAVLQGFRLLHQLDGRLAAHTRGLEVDQPSAHVFGRDEK
jgi:hypothetical protein